jgi:hypothetical protein
MQDPQSDNDGRVVGLIPMAVGSTSIAEWQPDYVSNYSVSERGTVLPDTNARYHPNALNIFTCALRTLYLALKQLIFDQCGHNVSLRKLIRVAGMVWYQGENDTAADGSTVDITSQTHVGSYTQQFIRFLGCFGKCSGLVIELLLHEYQLDVLYDALSVVCQNVPVVTVAVTTTRPWLCRPPGQLSVIREQQLSLPALLNSGRLLWDTGLHDNPSMDWGIFSPSNFTVIDSFGLPMRADGVHLTAMGYIRLGIESAHQLAGVNRPEIAPLACAGQHLEKVQHSLRNLREVYSDFQRRCVELVSSADLPDLIHSVSQLPNVECVPLSTVASSNKASKQNALRCGLKASNFVYGEVSFIDLVSLFVLAAAVSVPSPDPSVRTKAESSFVSLGCGSGPCVAAAVMSGVFDNILGIEIMKYKFVECCFLASLIQGAIMSDGALQCLKPSGVSRIPVVRIVEGSFGSGNWQVGATVVYTCATCYASDQLEQLFRDCLLLDKGAKIVLIDSQVLLDTALAHKYQRQHEQQYELNAGAMPPFVLIASKQCKASWGFCCGYVFEKVVEKCSLFTS